MKNNMHIIQLLFMYNKEKAPQSACNYSREKITMGERLMFDYPGFRLWEFKQKLHGDGVVSYTDHQLKAQELVAIILDLTRLVYFSWCYLLVVHLILSFATIPLTCTHTKLFGTDNSRLRVVWWNYMFEFWRFFIVLTLMRHLHFLV